MSIHCARVHKQTKPKLGIELIHCRRSLTDYCNSVGPSNPAVSSTIADTTRYIRSRYGIQPETSPTNRGIVPPIFKADIIKTLESIKIDQTSSNKQKTLENIRDKALISLLYEAHLSSKEVSNLTRDDIIWDQKPGTPFTLQLPSTETNDGPATKLHIGDTPGIHAPELVKNWLEHLPEKGVPLFPRVYKYAGFSLDGIGQSNISRVFIDHVRKANPHLKKCNMTGIRKGFILEAHENGMSPIEIRSIVRHVSLSTVEKHINSR